MKVKLIAAAAALAVAAGGGAVAAATVASASTSACTNSGAWSGYCGTQVDNESAPVGPVAMDDQGQKAAQWNPIIAWPDNPGDAGTDFLNIQYQGGSNVEFIYAPNGNPTNLCVTVSGINGKGWYVLALRTCGGWTWQLFTPVQVAAGQYNWKNVQTGDVLTSEAGFGKYAPMAVRPASTSPDPAQEWHFAG